MARARGGAGLCRQPAGVPLVGLVANPQALSVSDLASFSAAHGLTTSWQFLTGSLSQRRRVWSAYGIYAAIVDGHVDHTPAVYIINRQGREETLFETQMAYASIAQQGRSWHEPSPGGCLGHRRSRPACPIGMWGAQPPARQRRSPPPPRRAVGRRSFRVRGSRTW